MSASASTAETGSSQVEDRLAGDPAGEQGVGDAESADKIKDDVLRGVLNADEQVMSTNQYAVFYRINPATAAKAFQQLVEEGVLYKRRGIGMFVSPDARERLRAQRRQTFFAQLVEPMLVEAEAVGISRREIVDYIENKGGEPR